MTSPQSGNQPSPPLASDLLRSDPLPSVTDELHATINAHGLYNSLQFVLRLSPEVHRKLAALPNGIGIASSRDVSFDVVQAFSTYLHETVHWWQHMGSTYGLMTSLCFPSQTHANYVQIKRLIAEKQLKKPIRKLTKQLPGPSHPDTLEGVSNIIVNNHFDLGAFRRLSYDLESAKALIADPLFDSIGHAIEVTYGNNLLTMSGVVDLNFRVLPDPRQWEEPFQKLREANVEGFYYGGPVVLWPIGAREIMEGQACFSQIQYLHFASGRKLNWNDFRTRGMLHGVYVKAFEEFLLRAELGWPPTIDHPAVALFLLICDMAINPGSGFPFSPAPHYRSFITDTVPGIRFTSLSTMVRLRCPSVAGAITDYTRAEYEDVTEQLASLLLDRSPLEIAETCSRWASGFMAPLMAEYSICDFGPMNTVARVLLSHFLAFMEDKYTTPEYFCWPGAWMAGERVSEKLAELFDRHSALFVDKADNDGIFPRLRSNCDEVLVQKMFETFYSANIVYSLTEQLISKEGAFSYDYDWLKPSASRAKSKEFANSHFQQIYGIHPDAIPLL
jgi:hypothetical protein